MDQINFYQTFMHFQLAKNFGGYQQLQMESKSNSIGLKYWSVLKPELSALSYVPPAIQVVICVSFSALYANLAA